MAAPRFFEGLEFLRWGVFENYQAWIDATFGHYSFNYVHRGALQFRMSGGAFHRIEGPAVWLAFPGPRFEYGSRDGKWEHRYIAFRGERVASWIKGGLLPI